MGFFICTVGNPAAMMSILREYILRRAIALQQLGGYKRGAAEPGVPPLGSHYSFFGRLHPPQSYKDNLLYLLKCGVFLRYGKLSRCSCGAITQWGPREQGARLSGRQFFVFDDWSAQQLQR